MEWVCKRFSEAGAPIEAVYFSPFHPTEGLGKYRVDDPSRKPRPGMIIQAERELRIELGASMLIGDQVSDIQAGVEAGVGVNLLLSQGPVTGLEESSFYQVNSISEASMFLKPPRE